MYFNQLNKLKDFDFTLDSIKLLDNSLHTLYDEGIERFVPSVVSRRSSLDIKEVEKMLLRASQFKLIKPSFEIECPEGDSDFYVDDLTKVDWRKETQCRVCDSIYVPNENNIWLTFSIIGQSNPKVNSRQTKGGYSSSGKILDYINKPEWGDFFSSHIVDIDKNQYSILFERFVKSMPSGTNKEKGDSLEELSEYFLSSIKAFKVESKINTKTGELDRWIKVNAIPGSFLRNWPVYIPVECKNCNTPSPRSVIDVLSTKASNLKSNYGILFSRNGVTGRKDSDDDALGQIRSLFDSKEFVTIVIDLDDLKSVYNGTNPLILIEEKQSKIYTNQK